MLVSFLEARQVFLSDGTRGEPAGLHFSLELNHCDFIEFEWLQGRMVFRSH